MKIHLIAALLAFAASDAAAQSWVELTPGAGSAPAGRRQASAIHDPVDNRMVIFGGFSNTFLNDIWAFDLDTETWENLTPVSGPVPLPRLTPASIYDADNHRMITWSGQGQGAFFNDVWAFDLTTETWSQFAPTGGPPNVRYGVGYAWDPVAEELVTFAGFTNLGRFDDVWRFNDSAVTWSDVTPGGVGPIERCLHAGAYDPVDHRLIMYGGQNAGPLDDLWALDFDTNTWTELTPAIRPDGRYFTAFVHDDANHRITMFGGQTSITAVNEVWVYDLWTDAWTQLAPTGTPPSQRFGSAGIYDGANDRMIVFGGSDGFNQNDVWALENLSGAVTSVRPGAAQSVLHANHPNPFNPTTTIRFDLATAATVTVRVYDVQGRAIRTLFDGAAAAGSSTLVWNGRDDRGNAVASGVYLYRLDGAGAPQTRKMVLLK